MKEVCDGSDYLTVLLQQLKYFLYSGQKSVTVHHEFLPSHRLTLAPKFNLKPSNRWCLVDGSALKSATRRRAKNRFGSKEGAGKMSDVSERRKAARGAMPEAGSTGMGLRELDETIRNADCDKYP